MAAASKVSLTERKEQSAALAAALIGGRYGTDLADGLRSDEFPHATKHFTQRDMDALRKDPAAVKACVLKEKERVARERELWNALPDELIARIVAEAPAAALPVLLRLEQRVCKLAMARRAQLETFKELWRAQLNGHINDEYAPFSASDVLGVVSAKHSLQVEVGNADRPGMIALRAGLEAGAFSEIKSLSFLYSNLSDANLRELLPAFAQGAMPQLEELQIYANFAGNRFMADLSLIVASGGLPHLCVLDLSKNKIGDAGMVAFADAIARDEAQGAAGEGGGGGGGGGGAQADAAELERSEASTCVDQSLARFEKEGAKSIPDALSRLRFLKPRVFNKWVVPMLLAEPPRAPNESREEREKRLHRMRLLDRLVKLMRDKKILPPASAAVGSARGGAAGALPIALPCLNSLSLYDNSPLTSRGLTRLSHTLKNPQSLPSLAHISVDGTLDWTLSEVCKARAILLGEWQGSLHNKDPVWKAWQDRQSREHLIRLFPFHEEFKTWPN